MSINTCRTIILYYSTLSCSFVNIDYYDPVAILLRELVFENQIKESNHFKKDSMDRNMKKVIQASTCEKSPGLAEIFVSYKTKSSNKTKILNSRDAFNALYPLFDINTIELKEEFFLLLLNRANNILGWFKLSSGGTSGTVVDIRIVFVLALQTNTSNLILCHNHPSQNIQPSEADIILTKRMKEAGSLLDIKVLDHLIIASSGAYFTFADEGLL
jgi:DNA repair protein RadC